MLAWFPGSLPTVNKQQNSLNYTLGSLLCENDVGVFGLFLSSGTFDQCFMLRSGKIQVTS